MLRRLIPLFFSSHLYVGCSSAFSPLCHPPKIENELKKVGLIPTNMNIPNLESILEEIVLSLETGPQSSPLPLEKGGYILQCGAAPPMLQI